LRLRKADVEFELLGHTRFTIRAVSSRSTMERSDLFFLNGLFLALFFLDFFNFDLEEAFRERRDGDLREGDRELRELLEMVEIIRRTA
jgi:hypothetical protein